MSWKRKPQECPGDYSFSGKLLITRTVYQRLVDSEIRNIITDLRKFVRSEGGLVDYLQVYENQITGEKLYFIDNLSQSDKKEFADREDVKLEDYDYHTLLFAQEY